MIKDYHSEKLNIITNRCYNCLYTSIWDSDVYFVDHLHCQFCCADTEMGTGGGKRWERSTPCGQNLHLMFSKLMTGQTIHHNEIGIQLLNTQLNHF